MIDVLYFADAKVKQKLFAQVKAARRLTLVTVLPPHRAGGEPRRLTPFCELERDYGAVLDQVLVLDEGKIEGMWRDPVVDLADALYPGDKKAAYAAARGYLLVLRGEPKLTVKKSSDRQADLERLEKALERLTLKRQAAPAAGQGRAPEEEVAGARAWAVLGVAPGASLGEVRAAWKALLVQYHPDKVAHLAPEFRALAEQKTRELNDAWQQLKGALGG